MPVIHSFKPEPMVRAQKQPKLIDPARLSDRDKKIVWEGVKKLDPEQAKLLVKDSEIELFKNEFSATVRFKETDFNRFTEAGNKIIKRDK